MCHMCGNLATRRIIISGSSAVSCSSFLRSFHLTCPFLFFSYLNETVKRIEDEHFVHFEETKREASEKGPGERHSTSATA